MGTVGYVCKLHIGDCLCKTSHVTIQIVIYFQILKSDNSVTAHCSYICLLIQLYFGVKQLNVDKTMGVLHSFV